MRLRQNNGDEERVAAHFGLPLHPPTALRSRRRPQTAPKPDPIRPGRGAGPPAATDQTCGIPLSQNRTVLSHGFLLLRNNGVRQREKCLAPNKPHNQYIPIYTERIV